MSAIQKLIKGIEQKQKDRQHIMEIEWLLSIAYHDTGIDKGTINKAAAELAARTARLAQAERERDEWRASYFALEWDDTTGECLLGCGGQASEGHEDDCIFIAKLPDPKVAPSTALKGKQS